MTEVERLTVTPYGFSARAPWQSPECLPDKLELHIDRKLLESHIAYVGAKVGINDGILLDKGLGCIVIALGLNLEKIGGEGCHGLVHNIPVNVIAAVVMP